MTDEEFYSCHYCGTDTWDSGHLLRANGIECTCCDKCYEEHFTNTMDCVLYNHSTAD